MPPSNYSSFTMINPFVHLFSTKIFSPNTLHFIPRRGILGGLLFITLLPLFSSCRPDAPTTVMPRMLFEYGSYPHAAFYNGTYYFTSQSPNDDIRLAATVDLARLPQAEEHIIFNADSLGLFHAWAPEIFRIDGNWYIYFEADNGNTDNHQLYVIQCQGDDPLHDEWVLRDTLHTNTEWNYGIHPNVLEVGGQLYLFWSGWPKRRVEHETQCIYVARMSNPWTVSSERVLLSRPEHEWERQWINPDGSRSAYPIYVNENPEAYLSPDGRTVCVCYSASGIWTRYHILGMLTAPATSDLLDPASWTKSVEPILVDDNLYGASNICIIPSANPDSTYLLFDALWERDGQERRSIFLKTISWGPDGRPVFK